MNANVRPCIAVPVGNTMVGFADARPLGAPYAFHVFRRPLSQGIYAPVNTLLMIPALAVLGFYTFVGLAFEPKRVELNALLWGLGALSFVSVTRRRTCRPSAPHGIQPLHRPSGH